MDNNGQFIPLAIDQLPQRLQDKLCPRKPLTAEERNRQALMNASISPAKYRRAAGAGDSQPAAGVPPTTNRGGKGRQGDLSRELPSLVAKEILKIVPVGRGNRAKFVAIPLPDKAIPKSHAFIDWVNFTFKTAALPLFLNSGHQAVDDEDYIRALSAEMNTVFGYGVTAKRRAGQNFYQHTYDLGQDGWGTISIGGQRDTVLVTVKGQGLMAAQPGWEMRLYRWLKAVSGAKLTRVDLAADNFESDTTLDDYLAMFHAGLFTQRVTPTVEQAGNWVNPNGKGRTLYIGSRVSGKLLRIYEKGLQLANGFHERFPNWVRVELELKAIDRVIPLECLLRPGQYLAGAYPALARFHERQERVETFKRTAQSTVERALQTTRHQFGKYIWTFAQIHGADQALAMLTQGKEQLPKKLVFDTFEQCRPDDFLHHEPIVIRPLEEIPHV